MISTRRPRPPCAISPSPNSSPTSIAFPFSRPLVNCEEKSYSNFENDDKPVFKNVPGTGFVVEVPVASLFYDGLYLMFELSVLRNDASSTIPTIRSSRETREDGRYLNRRVTRSRIDESEDDFRYDDTRRKYRRSDVFEERRDETDEYDDMYDPTEYEQRRARKNVETPENVMYFSPNYTLPSGILSQVVHPNELDILLGSDDVVSSKVEAAGYALLDDHAALNQRVLDWSAEKYRKTIFQTLFDMFRTEELNVGNIGNDAMSALRKFLHDAVTSAENSAFDVFVRSDMKRTFHDMPFTKNLLYFELEDGAVERLHDIVRCVDMSDDFSDAVSRARLPFDSDRRPPTELSHRKPLSLVLRDDAIHDRSREDKEIGSALCSIFLGRLAQAVTDVLNEDDATIVAQIRASANVMLPEMFDNDIVRIRPDKDRSLYGKTMQDRQGLQLADLRLRPDAIPCRTPEDFVAMRHDETRLCWISQGVEMFLNTIENFYSSGTLDRSSIAERVARTVRRQSMPVSPIKCGLLGSKVRKAAADARNYLYPYGESGKHRTSLDDMSFSYDSAEVDIYARGRRDLLSELCSREDEMTSVEHFLLVLREYQRRLQRSRIDVFSRMRTKCAEFAEKTKTEFARINPPILSEILFPTYDQRVVQKLFAGAPKNGAAKKDQTLSEYFESIEKAVFEDLKMCIERFERARRVKDRSHDCSSKGDDESTFARLMSIVRDSEFAWLRDVAARQNDHDDTDGACLVFWLDRMRSRARRIEIFESWRRDWRGGFVGTTLVRGSMYKQVPSHPKIDEFRDLITVEFWSVVCTDLQLAFLHGALIRMHTMETNAFARMDSYDAIARSHAPTINEHLFTLVGLFVRRSDSLLTPGDTRSVHANREYLRRVEERIRETREKLERSDRKT